MDCPKRRERDMEAALGLPEDPLVEILSRVPAKSLCRFKCVSKAWHDLIADPLHRKKLPQALKGFFFMVEKHYFHNGESGYDYETCACYGGDGECRCPEDSDEEGVSRYRFVEEEVPRYGFVDVLQRSVRFMDFSYLTEQPGIKNTMLIHCCNGLLLFAVKRSRPSSLSYAVCNPVTQQCVAVPSSGLEKNEVFDGSAVTYLLFDPAGAPCHFNLVQFSNGGYQKSVHVYSSKTQAWSHNKPVPGCYDIPRRSVYVNGMLHLISYFGDDLTVLDVQGNIQKIISPPFQSSKEKWMTFGYIGWSQGCLHCINSETPDDEEIDGDGFGRTEPSFRGLLIWVLEDYERQQWVLKDTVSFSMLFGDKDIDFDYDVVGIHPDHSLVFLVQLWDQKLISYHMDSKEVRHLCTLRHGFECITPYVPCFSELLAFENKQ